MSLYNMIVLSYIAKHDVTLEPIYKSIVLAGEDVKFFMYEVWWRLYVVAILVYSNYPFANSFLYTIGPPTNHLSI